MRRLVYPQPRADQYPYGQFLQLLTQRTPVALFGRGSQTDVLAGLIDSARACAGGAVLVRGAPGIGKSALLADAATRASAAGFTVARAFGEQAGSDVPYGGLQQFVHSLGIKLDMLAEPQRSALALSLIHI